MVVFWEIIGYTGTALVLLSMLMTSVTKLRWLNLAGSVFSLAYGLWSGAMPVFVLNISLAAINALQLRRFYRLKKEETV